MRHALLSCALASIALGTAGAAIPALALRAQASENTSFSLISESDSVGPHTKLNLSFRVRSPLPTTELGVKLTLYSRLTSRYSFGLSETGKEPASELVLGATPIIPLDDLLRGLSPNAAASLKVRVVTAPSARSSKLASPVLALDCLPGACDGVYPLEVVVVDRTTDKPLASITSDVIYVGGTAGTYRLNVAVVFSIGTGLGLAPDGASTVSLRRITALEKFVSAIGAQTRTAMTLNAYSQILLALERSHEKRAKHTLTRLRSLVASGGASGNLEVLDSPFTEVSATELSRAGLVRDLKRQFATGHAISRRLVGAQETGTSYLATSDIDQATVATLRSVGISRLVVPEASITPTEVTTPTAPFMLQSGSTTTTGAPEGLVADAGLASQLHSSSDPVVAAHNFLADLAQTFFEEPFSTGPRGVVVAPTELPSSSRIVSIVLNGLRSIPILHSMTLDELYSAVPIGSNAEPRSVRLTGGRGGGGSHLGHEISSARSMLTDLQSVIPDDAAFLNRTRAAILLAETNGIAGSSLSRYLDQPNSAFAAVRSSLALSGTRTVTIGQHRARIPVTFDSNFPSIVHADLEISSGAIALSSGEVSQPIVLARKN
ncbi:MAG: hypothetical protein WB770_08080, partial [Acidimicrobiales bacterium]